jgi:hypothetical protein
MAEANIPKELILPIPDGIKETDLYKTLKDYSSAVNDSLEAIKEGLVDATAAGAGLSLSGATLSVNADDTTIEIDGDDNLAIKAVPGSLLTSLSSIPSGAGVIPSANLPAPEVTN